MSASDERKRLRAGYEALFGLVAAVIRAWDPLGLLAGGAPRDEPQELAATGEQLFDTLKRVEYGKV